VDVFSKYAYVRTLSSKTGREVADAFKDILSKDAERPPLFVQTDKGKEFRSSAFEDLAKREGIKVFSTENDDVKASIVERFQRTLQTMMHRHFTATGKRTFLAVLPKLVKTYNTTRHRAIGMAPADVKPSNYEIVWRRLYEKRKDRAAAVSGAAPKLKVGDSVRLSETRRTFAKGYLGHWSLEIFRVTSVLKTRPPTYRLKDARGEPILGSFYEQELQRVVEPEYWPVDAIVDTRTRQGIKEYLVKWAGYPESFNSWERNVIKART
jgi:hypothetical protein